MKLIDHYINGENANFSGLSSTPVFNPASGEETARVVSGTTECINAAVNQQKKFFLSGLIQHQLSELGKCSS